MERYHDIILREARIGRKAMEDQMVMFDRNDNDFKGMLTKLRINVVGSCEKMPYLHMNEKCKYSLRLFSTQKKRFT